MKKIIVRELFVFGVLFILLALSVHYKEWLSHPIAHVEALPSSQFGVLHPLLFTLFFYILVLIVRVAIHLARKLKAKI
jgi:hypothetical protein